MLAALVKVEEEAATLIFETLTKMVDDDLEFCRSAPGAALLKVVNAVMGAKAELERERDRLGEPRQGERARVDWPPLQAFLLMAELLWTNEVRTDFQKRTGLPRLAAAPLRDRDRREGAPLHPGAG